MPHLVLLTAGGVFFAKVINLFRKRSVLDRFSIPPHVLVAGFLGVAIDTILLA